MAWEYIATGMSSLTVALILANLARQGSTEKRFSEKLDDLEDKIDLQKESLIRIMVANQKDTKKNIDELCRERQSHCSDLVNRDIQANRCEIQKINTTKKEMWQDHMRKCHRDGCPE